MAAPPSLTLEQCKSALNDALAALEVPENKAKIEAAKAEAGKDLMKLMQGLIPVVVSVLGDKIQAYGFPPNQMGVMQLVQASGQFKDDPEIAAGQAKIKSVVMPTL